MGVTAPRMTTVKLNSALSVPPAQHTTNARNKGLGIGDIVIVKASVEKQLINLTNTTL